MEKLKKSSLTHPTLFAVQRAVEHDVIPAFDYSQKVTECQQRTEFELEDRERDSLVH